MERIEKLKFEVQKYLKLKKIFRTGEALVSLIVGALLFALGEGFGDIFACVVVIFLIPEAFLIVQRSGIKSQIKDEILLSKKEIEFYSWMKSEFEKMKNEFISQGSKNFISDECKQLVWREEMGTGWLSLKARESGTKCDEAKQTIESLESIKKRLVIF